MGIYSVTIPSGMLLTTCTRAKWRWVYATLYGEMAVVFAPLKLHQNAVCTGVASPAEFRSPVHPAAASI